MAKTKTIEPQTEMGGFKIRTAFVHQAITVPGHIMGEKTLTHTKIPGIQMTYTPHGLFLKTVGRAGASKGGTAITIIPLSNVINAIVDED